MLCPHPTNKPVSKRVNGNKMQNDIYLMFQIKLLVKAKKSKRAETLFDLYILHFYFYKVRLTSSSS